MSEDAPMTRSMRRFCALLAALRAGPLTRSVLLLRVQDWYPQTDSARVMVDRDIRMLRELGIQTAAGRDTGRRARCNAGADCTAKP